MIILILKELTTCELSVENHKATEKIDARLFFVLK
jgi:hypothetical protein